MRGKTFFVATNFRKMEMFNFLTLTVTDTEFIGNLNQDVHYPASLNRTLHEKLSEPATVKTCYLLSLKVPKCEIFHLFDFNDFYGIKSL
jgi:hypothetical protein